jgi:hypothetical protein
MSDKYRDALKTLKELYDEGLIEKEEYTIKKAAILDKILVRRLQVTTIISLLY